MDEGNNWPNRALQGAGGEGGNGGSKQPHPSHHPYSLLPPQFSTTYMPPVTILPVITKNMASSLNSWLDDAPMPYDERYAGPSSGHQQHLNAQHMSVQHDMPLPPVLEPHNGYHTFHGPHLNYTMQYPPYDPRIQHHHTPYPAVVNGNLPDPMALQPVNLNPPQVHAFHNAEAEARMREQDKQLVNVLTEPHNRLLEDRKKLEQKPWCVVHYYEYKRKSGNPYEAFEKSFTIDGTSPNSDENFFAISGQPDTKQPRCSQVRNQLGAGCRLENRGGDIYMTVLTDQAMFVQCRFMGELKRNGIDTPIKLKNNQENKNSSGDEIVVKLFDKEKYQMEMEKAKGMTQADASAHLESFWSTRLSICKGFGEDYKHKRILDTPCWIEIQFTYPFEMADTFLRSHQVGMETMNSRS